LVRVDGVAILPTGGNEPLHEVDGWCTMGITELQFGDDGRQRVLRYRRL